MEDHSEAIDASKHADVIARTMDAWYHGRTPSEEEAPAASVVEEVSMAHLSDAEQDFMMESLVADIGHLSDKVEASRQRVWLGQSSDEPETGYLRPWLKARVPASSPNAPAAVSDGLPLPRSDHERFFVAGAVSLPAAAAAASGAHIPASNEDARREASLALGLSPAAVDLSLPHGHLARAREPITGIPFYYRPLTREAFYTRPRMALFPPMVEHVSTFFGGGLEASQKLQATSQEGAGAAPPALPPPPPPPPRSPPHSPASTVVAESQGGVALSVAVPVRPSFPRNVPLLAQSFLEQKWSGFWPPRTPEALFDSVAPPPIPPYPDDSHLQEAAPSSSTPPQAALLEAASKLSPPDHASFHVWGPQSLRRVPSLAAISASRDLYGPLEGSQGMTFARTSPPKAHVHSQSPGARFAGLLSASTLSSPIVLEKPPSSTMQSKSPTGSSIGYRVPAWVLDKLKAKEELAGSAEDLKSPR